MRSIWNIYATALFLFSVNASALTSQELADISTKIDSIQQFASKQREKQNDRTIQKEWMFIATQLSNSALSYKVAALELAIIEKQCNIPINNLVFPTTKQLTNTEAFNTSLLMAHVTNKRFIVFLEEMGEIDPSQPFNLVAKNLESAQEGATPYLEKLAQKNSAQRVQSE